MLAQTEGASVTGGTESGGARLGKSSRGNGLSDFLAVAIGSR